MGESIGSKPPVQILQSGARIDRAAVPALRSEFAQSGIAFLPGFLAPSVLDLVLKQVAMTGLTLRNEVSKATASVFGTTRRAMLTDPSVIALHFLLNRPDLFGLAAEVSGVPRPGNFICRLHRTEPVADQHIDWHDDLIDDRVLGLDINLSTDRFQGGLFQIRSPDKKIQREIAFSQPGDAFLFRIGDSWEHRLTLVEEGSRTVAVGWFRLQPDWQITAAALFTTGTGTTAAGEHL